MATTLRVTPEIAKSKATQIVNMAQEIERLTTSITTIVEELTGRVWSGEANTSYINSFKALQADVDKLVKITKDNGDHLMAIAEEYEATEKAAVERSSALDKNFL